MLRRVVDIVNILLCVIFEFANHAKKVKIVIREPRLVEFPRALCVENEKARLTQKNSAVRSSTTVPLVAVCCCCLLLLLLLLLPVDVVAKFATAKIARCCRCARAGDSACSLAKGEREKLDF
jgi:hypothetical protein